MEDINKDRLVDLFIKLVKIDSPTFNERKIIDYLKQIVSNMGLEYYEDEAYKNTNGNAGNLICKYKGKGIKPKLLFMAHVDNVDPCLGVKPVIEGDVIKSDGSTVLGGDDLAGVAIIIETLRIIKENNISCGDIEVVFSVSEEGGLFGAKNMDYSKIDSKYAFVLDGNGEIGTVAVKAPYHNSINIDIYGKAAHSGIEPEKGIDAIQIAANAISKLKIGRIDKETTSNLGIIKGGRATNIVCEHVEINGEIRSIDQKKLHKETQRIVNTFEKETKKQEGKIEQEVTLEYSGYNISKDNLIMKMLSNACNNLGIELVPEVTGGGSDTNILNSNSITAVDMSIGMTNVHTVDEYIKISDMIKCSQLLIEIIKEFEKKEVE